MKSKLPIFIPFWLILQTAFLAACMPNNTPPGPEGMPAQNTVPAELEVAREGVFVLADGRRQAVSAAEQVANLLPGQGLAVDDAGRAILRLGSRQTLELLRGAELPQIRQIPDGDSLAVETAQNGGTLVVDLASGEGTNLLTVQTAFGTVNGKNARFAIVREANSPLEWVLGLSVPDNGSLDVTVGGVTQPVAGGQARWMTSADAPGSALALAETAQTWLENARNDVEQPEIGAVLLPPANILADTGLFSTAPAPGKTVDFGQSAQGSVKLTADPQGIFGTPAYTLEDCNGDGTPDLAIKNGILHFDFRELQARVEALDATLFNRDRPGYGLWQGLNPAGATTSRQQIEVGPGQTQTLSLRAEQPFHFATLTVGDACFLGLSLTPGSPGSQPPPARPVVAEPPQNDVVVNVLAASETPVERAADAGEFTANRVISGTLQIDGSVADWAALPPFVPMSGITHDAGCAVRYPDAGALADLGGRVQFAYDDTFLYVAFDVNDDGLLPYTGSDDRIFLGDSVQLLLDLDLAGDADQSQLSSDDVQIDILPQPDAPRAALWQLSTLTSGAPAGARVAAAPTDTGYLVEAALPWAGLGTIARPGDRLGVVAAINDNDSPDSNNQECIISTAPRRDWRNPTTWGTLLLKPE
ncbi:MAG: hypothetical protein D6768_20895 [Chloroflexi bacterium]|nr:MAG: hypothetical protein D6768_20895 [Chloroflexota bacterium]